MRFQKFIDRRVTAGKFHAVNRSSCLEKSFYRLRRATLLPVRIHASLHRQRQRGASSAILRIHVSATLPSAAP